MLTSGTVQLPDELTGEAVRLGTSTDPDVQLAMSGASRPELAATALERAGWWRSFASFGASAGQANVAHVVHRTYFLLWQQLQEPTP